MKFPDWLQWQKESLLRKNPKAQGQKNVFSTITAHCVNQTNYRFRDLKNVVELHQVEKTNEKLWNSG